MATLIHLDTHVVVWLYMAELELFPPAVRRDLNRAELVISPIIELELQYLFELDRVTVPAAEIVGELQHSVGLRFSEASFQEVVRSALGNQWTRDPFDRLIAAQAAVEAAPLLTKDANIRRHYRMAYWGKRKGQ